MDMRLAYRVLSEPALLPAPGACRVRYGPKEEVALRQRLKLQAEYMATVPHLVLDNVAAYYAAHSRQEWHLGEDIPSWAPPFGAFWAEWNDPATYNMGAGGPVKNGGESQAGCLVVAYDVTDDNRDDLDDWKRLLGALAGQDGPINLGDRSDDDLRRQLAASRWVLFCDAWGSANVQPICGRPVWAGLSNALLVAETGKCVFPYDVSVVAPFGSGGPSTGHLHVLGLGLSFCHCKNVAPEELVGTPRPGHRKSKVPALKFYTLNIGRMREVLRTEGRSGEVGLAKALHICRGHFANYGEDKPLFGKYAGRFWVPDHVRGRAEAGEVVKNYSADPPLRDGPPEEEQVRKGPDRTDP
jgi:hypothetical protein